MKKEFTKDEIKKVGQEIYSLIISKKNKNATIVALSGDLGVGKTTLTQSIAKHLGITESVISPTFVIMKRYALRDSRYANLIHIDAYRLNLSSELLRLGWEEIISNPKNLVLIEWPERVIDIIPKNCIQISLSHHTENTRKISIK